MPEARRALTDRELECLRTVAGCPGESPASPQWLIRRMHFGRKLLIRLAQWGLIAVDGRNYFTARVTTTPVGNAILAASAADFEPSHFPGKLAQ